MSLVDCRAVVISDKGWVRARSGNGHDPAGFAFKAGDEIGRAHV